MYTISFPCLDTEYVVLVLMKNQNFREAFVLKLFYRNRESKYRDNLTNLEIYMYYYKYQKNERGSRNNRVT